MVRFLALLFGLVGAVGASQAPEFTQQYMQNLRGGVDRLEEVVARFDDDARRSGLSRDEAVDLCLEDRRGAGTMSCLGRAEDVATYQRYAEQLEMLRDAGEWERPITLLRNLDRGIAESVRQEYRPAVPTTVVGGGYALAGFALLWGIAAMVFGLVGNLFGGGNRY